MKDPQPSAFRTSPAVLPGPPGTPRSHGHGQPSTNGKWVRNPADACGNGRHIDAHGRVAGTLIVRPDPESRRGQAVPQGEASPSQPWEDPGAGWDTARVLVGAMQLMADELAAEMDEVQVALAAGQSEAARAHAQTVQQLVAWLGAGCSDLHGEIGTPEPMRKEEVAIPQILTEAAARLGKAHGRMRFVHGFYPADSEPSVLGARVVLRVALRLAMELVVERIGSVGTVHTSVEVADARGRVKGEVWIGILGDGAPHPLRGGSRIECLRGLVQRLGGRLESVDGKPVVDHPMGTGGTGLVICLPPGGGAACGSDAPLP